MIKAERVFLIDTCYTYAEETFSTREHNNVAEGDNNVRKCIKYSSLNGWAFLLMGLCLLCIQYTLVIYYSCSIFYITPSINASSWVIQILSYQEECWGIKLFTQPYFHKHIGNVYLCKIILRLWIIKYIWLSHISLESSEKCP